MQLLQLGDDVTHVAVQLINCHTVPVGLFTNVTHHLTSVTVASQDAVQLLEGTFQGLQQVTEFRLLGFTMLNNLSRSVLEPLRNIRTLILDGFGSMNIALPYIGSVIRKLSGTPIRRLVLDRIKGRLFFQMLMQVDNFRISNASVKQLVITDTPFNYVGSIRLAFPDLVCFYGGGTYQATPVTYSVIYDLILLSDQLKELVVHQLKGFASIEGSRNHTFYSHITHLLVSNLKTGYLYPDLVDYFHTMSHSKRCELGVIFRIGANLSKITLNGMLISMKFKKPLCVHEDNNLTYCDITDSHIISNNMPLLIGLKKLTYLSLENTGIRRLPNTFLRHYPALKVLKLSRLDIGRYIGSIDEKFFGSCPSLSVIYLADCNVVEIPSTIFSKSVNLQQLDMSKNYLRTFNVDLQNCTKLGILNFSRNIVESSSEESLGQLTELALQKAGGNNLRVDLSYNRLHCLCNSTHFIKWLQRSPAESNIKFPGFDRYTCLYPNGSKVLVSEVSVDKLEEQCSVIETLVNGSDCPCEEEQRRRLEQVWMQLDGFFCRNDAGDLVTMKNQPLPSCFNAYLRASFIAPVVVGGILGIALLTTVGLVIYYRNSKPVKQVRECLEMNPVRFVSIALQYVMLHNRDEEQAVFRYDVMVFAHDDDCSSIHGHFIRAMRGNRSLITRDDFLPGAAVVDAMVECIRDCQWIVPVLTSNFLSDPVCVDFISRAQFTRPHALIPVVWEQPLDVTDISVAELLRTGDALHWPAGDHATAERSVHEFWSALLDRTTPL